MNKYDVIIIGCGSIGAIKPDKFDSPETKNILTWGHAFFYLKGDYSLTLHFIDYDLNKAKLASEKWGGKAYKDLETFRKENTNNNKRIFVVAVPTNKHFKVLSRVIKFNPSLVIAEKPFTDNLEDAKTIRYLYLKKNIPLMVDYIRRFDPVTSVIKNAIDLDMLGNIQQCRVIYNRGFKREASHALDLMHLFFGEYKSGLILDTNDVLIDYDKHDPSYTAHLSFELCRNVLVLPADGREFSIFEIDILGTKGRYTLVDHGKFLRKHSVIQEPTYGNYNTLCSTYDLQETKLTTALLFAAENALHCAERGERLFCTADNAIDTHKIYYKLGV